MTKEYLSEKKISGVIITYNEERKIASCINSLKQVCEEILVVDSLSEDNTVDIAIKSGATVISQAFLGYIEQKNFAADQAKYPYILSLDADEELSDKLRDFLMREKARGLHDAYSFPRLNNLYGKWMRHGQWYPDRKIRLWKKSIGHWGGMNPHDKVILDSQLEPKKVRYPILHYAYDKVGDHIIQTNKFAHIYAQAAHLQGRKSRVFTDIVVGPFFKFFKSYFLKLGFLDGYYGFVASYNAAILNYYKYVYLREFNRHRVNEETE
jgi:glycosyltransferase involved in cell wall biosynthesis